MSAFVAGGATTSFIIESDDFWPPIDAAHLRATLRIDASVSDPRLETAIVAAAISVNRDLGKWRSQQQAKGHTTLDSVPAETINNISVLCHLYARAIQAATGAEVCERYRSYDSTGTGERKAEALQFNIDEYRRDQRWAIRDLLGIGRMTVELI